MSKYNEAVLKILKKEQLKSTNEILKELEELSGKVINWHALYRLLIELAAEGKAEKVQTKAGFFWKKNN
jgi:arginine repressor